MDSEFKNFSIEKNALKVPFGKYKDHEITDLLADTNYIEWLAQQSWMKEKYPVIFQVIQQYNFEDQPTPEHNAMQIKWLENDYKKLFFEFFIKNIYYNNRITGFYWFNNLKFEFNGWDVKFEYSIIDKEKFYENYYEYKEFFDQFFGPYFEIGWLNTDNLVDYRFSEIIKRQQNNNFILIELKPIISDDYPSILKKMDKPLIIKNGSETIKYNGIKILIAQKIECSNISIEQIKKFFWMNKIYLFLESEYEGKE